MFEREELITKALKRVNLIAIPFFVILPAIFLLLAFNLEISAAKRVTPDNNIGMLLYVLIGESFIISAMAVFIFRKLPSFLLKRCIKRSAFSAKTGPIKTDEFVTIAQNFCLILYAFSEGTIIFGLLLFMLGFPIVIMIPFLAAGIISYLINRPNRKFLERFYDKLIELGLMKTD